MRPETIKRREERKRQRESRDRLFANEDFHEFLRYIHSAAGEVERASHWLPDWLVVGCELYFTDIAGKVKEIIKHSNEGGEDNENRNMDVNK